MRLRLTGRTWRTSFLTRRWASRTVRVAAASVGLAASVFAIAPQFSPGQGPELAAARGAFVEEIRNDLPAYQVRVSVDHPDGVYRDGESMIVKMRSNRKGYAYLLYASADGKVSCLFPNKFQQDNLLQPDGELMVPAKDKESNEAKYRIRIGSPFGKEVLKLIVTEQPLKEIAVEKLIDSIATPVELRAVRAAYVEELKPLPGKWAEHFVTITTLETGERVILPRKARVGLFIGINQFADPNIRKLSACVADAEKMAALMKTHGKLDQVFVLTDKQATREAIEKLIRRTLPEITRPGDEVFVYWSGHGGRCADENGDEKDGFDEFLVPYDGQTANMSSTMVLDDTFGRWMQNLDGRKVAVILDTCHSGGQAANEKGLVGAVGQRGAGVDMLDGDLAHVKDIGQKDVALLVSSRAAQVSFVRKQGDLSVMTHCLVELYENTPRLTLAAAAAQLKVDVPKFVAANFPGATQDPELLGDVSDPVLLKP
ncbi:MAG: caspase family protein [Pirellulales bacterium]